MKNKRVAIIGGGLAGILVAYYLSKKDGYHMITIFEKEKVLGGELATISVGNGWPLEKFYHHVFLKDQNVARLFDELGLGDKLLPRKSSTAVVYEKKVSPFSGPLDLLRLPFLPFITKLRMGLASLIIPRLNYHKFESISSKQLIIKFMGQVAWEKFWEPMFFQKFASFTDEISGAWFWGRLRDRVSSRKGGEVLCYPEGGFQILLDKLIGKLREKKVNILFEKYITKVERVGAGFEIDGESFDQVICTVPLPSVPGMSFDVKYVAVVTVILETKGKITDYYWANVLDKDLSFGVIVEQTNLIPAENYGTNLLYLGRYLSETDPLFAKTDEELASIFIRDLEKIFPGVTPKISKHYVHRDCFAQPIIPINFQPLNFETEVPDFYIFSSAHIYPEDRGLDRVISRVRLLTKLNNNPLIKVTKVEGE